MTGSLTICALGPVVKLPSAPRAQQSLSPHRHRAKCIRGPAPGTPGDPWQDGLHKCAIVSAGAFARAIAATLPQQASLGRLTPVEFETVMTTPALQAA